MHSFICMQSALCKICNQWEKMIWFNKLGCFFLIWWLILCHKRLNRYIHLKLKYICAYVKTSFFTGNLYALHSSKAPLNCIVYVANWGHDNFSLEKKTSIRHCLNSGKKKKNMEILPKLDRATVLFSLAASHTSDIYTC